MQFKIIIPSRFASSRLPGKPLLDIAGKPMVWHVYQRALETGIGEDNIFIATDHEEIESIAKSFGANVVMTREDHESGTDRLAEVATKLGLSESDIVVNLQGDEPLIAPELITLTARVLSDNNKAGMSTLACKLDEQSQLNDINCVKLVCDINKRAMYFSRSAIPFARDGVDANRFNAKDSPWLRHIGMYAYRVDTLLTLNTLPMVEIEGLEKLEQLRALYNGIGIQVACIDSAPGHGVDTQADLDRVRDIISKK